MLKAAIEKNLPITFASLPKNSVRKEEKKKKKRMALVKLFVLHANAKITLFGVCTENFILVICEKSVSG